MTMVEIKVPLSVIEWLADGERGCSSETIVEYLWGIPCTGRWGLSVPKDPADLRRCLLLLKRSPETAARFQEMRSAGLTWFRLVNRWPDLERLLIEEIGAIENCRGWKAPKTYGAMQKCLEGRAA